MPRQFFVLPTVLYDEDGTLMWMPKYHDTHLAGVGWSMMRYGPERWAIIRVDSDQAVLDLLAAESDVLAVPQDIDSSPGAAAVTVIQAKYDAVNLPSGWINTSRTYRQMLRVTAGCFMLLQRYGGIIGDHSVPVFSDGGVKLSKKLSSLPVDVRTNIETAANQLGLDTSFLIGDDTLGDMFRSFGVQWVDTPIAICGEEV